MRRERAPDPAPSLLHHRLPATEAEPVAHVHRVLAIALAGGVPVNLRGAPVLDADGRPVGRRDPVELGPTQDLAVYAVDMTVDRRRATPEELARLDPPPPAAKPGREGASMHPWRQYPPVAVVEEDPVTTPASPPALPCDDCLHEHVCYLRRELNHPETLLREPHILGPGLRLVFDAARVECDHQLPRARGGQVSALPILVVPDPDPKPVRAEHGGESWREQPSDAQRAATSRRRGTARSIEARRAKNASARYPLPRDRAERDRVVLEAVRATTTSAEAGERLGVTATRVQQLLRGLRDEGRLPADIAATIAARRSRGRLAVGDAEPGDPS